MDGGADPAPNNPNEWVYHVAEQLAAAELPARGGPEDPGGRKRRWVPVALAVVGVALAGAVIAVALTRGGDDDVETSASTTVTPSTIASITTTTATATTQPSTSVEPTTSAAPPTTAAATTEAPTTVAPETTAAPAPETTALDPNAPPVRWAEYADGQVTLKGRVPDQATADEVATRAAQVLGAANVHVEYEIDPTAPRPDSAPLYVNNSILFEPGFALLNARARDTLDLGVTLLNLFPQVTFDIEGHTDSTGSDEENLALSQRRVDAIVSYLVERGVDPARLSAVAKGESEPIADNGTPEGRALNRRIEIQVNNFLA